MELQQMLGGRYKLLSELGSGGMAVVWRARDEVLGRPVAVKVLAGRFAGDPHSRARIRDEARAAATLSHPNIAQVYDYGESTVGGTPLPYVVMELINGPTLQQRVARSPLPPRTVFRICGEVAAALAAAHADGLVHRDIKMANIMVATSGAKVVDFGIAAAIGPASPEDMVVGTPAYLAPERLMGAAVEPASDVYALGVLLYRLLAHHAPWSVETTTQMLNAHIYIEPEPLPQLPGVPPAITDLVARCLRKTPAGRPSAAEVSAMLGDAAEAAVLQTPDPVRARSPRIPRPAHGDFDEPTPSPARRGSGRSGSRSGAEAAAGAGAGLAASLDSAVSPGSSGPAANLIPAGSGSAAGSGSTIAGSGSKAPSAGSGDGGATSRRAVIAERGSVGGSGAGLGAGTGNTPDEDPESPAKASCKPGAGRPGNAAPAVADGLGRSGSRGGPGAGERRAGSPSGTRMAVVVGTGGGPRGGSGSRGDVAVEAGQGGAVGDGAAPVRHGKRNALLAGGGVAAALIVVLVLWVFAGGGTKEQADQGAVGVESVAPTRGSVSTAPSATGDGSVAVPAATEAGGRPPIAGSGPAPSVDSSAVAPANPVGPTPQPSSSVSAPASKAPDGTRLASPGGVAYARCDQGKATLTWWEPADGYTVQKVNPGPALTAEIVFRSASARYRMTVTCVAGIPTPVVLPL